MPARLIDAVAHLRRAEGGAVAVEFALILPLLLLLYLGSIEASSLITVDRRVTLISGSMGDLVARTDGTIGDADLTDYFNASTNVLFPYSTANLEQMVSLVRVPPTGDPFVVWSCSYSDGALSAGVPADTDIQSDDEIYNIARRTSSNGYVVVSDVTYPYDPVFRIVFPEVLTLRSQSTYLPRFEEEIGYTGSDC